MLLFYARFVTKWEGIGKFGGGRRGGLEGDGRRESTMCTGVEIQMRVDSINEDEKKYHIIRLIK